MSSIHLQLRALPLEKIGSRLATETERRFLQRHNVVRLISLLMVLLGMSPLAGLVLCANALLLWFGYGLRDQSIASQIGFGLLLLAVLLFLNGSMIKVFGKPWLALMRVRLMLIIPKSLEVTRWRSVLSVELHATHDALNIWLLGDRYIDVPEHWEKVIVDGARSGRKQVHATAAAPTSGVGIQGPDNFGLNDTTGVDEFVEVEMVSLPGASNQVIRFPMYLTESAFFRADTVFLDFGRIMLGVADVSADREIRAGLPIIRSSSEFFALWWTPALLAVGLWIGLGASSKKNELALRQNEWEAVLASMQAERPVDVAALAARGFTNVQTVSTWQGKLVTAEPVKMLKIHGSTDQDSFIMLIEEKRLIDSVIRYYPAVKHDRISYSYSKFDSIDANIAQFRDEIIALVDASDAAKPLRESLAQRIRAMPDALIQTHLRSHSRAMRPSTEFVRALEPVPVIRLAESSSPYIYHAPQGMSCSGMQGPCIVRNAVPRLPVISDDGSSLRLWPADQLDKLARLEADVERLRQPRPMDNWLTIAWRVCAALALSILVMHLLALLRIKRFYAKDAKDPSTR